MGNDFILISVNSVAATSISGFLALDVSFKQGEDGETITGPFGYSPDDNQGLSPLLHQWFTDNAGQFTIAPYVPPRDDEIRQAMPALEKWRVDSVIDLQPGLRDLITASIEAMPEPSRTISRNKLASVQQFQRTDPLFASIGTAIGMTDQQIDALWVQAQAL